MKHTEVFKLKMIQLKDTFSPSYHLYTASNIMISTYWAVNKFYVSPTSHQPFSCLLWNMFLAYCFFSFPAVIILSISQSLSDCNFSHFQTDLPNASISVWNSHSFTQVQHQPSTPSHMVADTFSWLFWSTFILLYNFICSYCSTWISELLISQCMRQGTAFMPVCVCSWQALATRLWPQQVDHEEADQTLPSSGVFLGVITSRLTSAFLWQ